jgi:hypothetical protein
MKLLWVVVPSIRDPRATRMVAVAADDQGQSAVENVVSENMMLPFS